MKFRNRDGDGVDPVPFFLLTAVAFATAYSFGPGYFVTLGLGLEQAVGASTGAFVVAAVGTYYRFVWTYDPTHREEVPVGDRFGRLVLAVAVLLAVIVLLGLPLLV